MLNIAGISCTRRADNDNTQDVHTTATLTHNAGGDSLGIVSQVSSPVYILEYLPTLTCDQVRYAIANYGVDPNNVFATGTSSGAMMTNVLMGA